MAKLSTIKPLAGFDFSFRPSLERNRILALAQLDFVDSHEVIHFLGPTAISPRRWAWRPVAASILQALPTSSALSPRPNGRGKIAYGRCPPSSTIKSAS
jgi:hypothetical protein